MNAEQCEKCHEQTATVYLTLIGPSAEPEKHNFCEACYEIFREERAKAPIHAANLQPEPSTRCKRCATMVLNEDLETFVTLPTYKI